MEVAEAAPVATQWLILIGVLLAAGLFYAFVGLIGIAFLGTISYYVVLIGTVVTMIALSSAVVSDLLDQLGPGKNLWWLTGPIATVGIFVPIYKAFRQHVLDDAVGWYDNARRYYPVVFLVIAVPVGLYATYQSTIETMMVGDVQYCTNCPLGYFHWFLMIVGSVAVAGVLLGTIFIFFHGGITALLGSVALLLHSVANGIPIDLMMLFDTLVGLVDEFFSVHLPGAAALIWSLLSAAYSLFQQLRG